MSTRTSSSLRRLVDEELWALLEPLIPAPQPGRRPGGRPRVDDRQVVEGILFVLSTGISWAKLSPEVGFGSGWTGHGGGQAADVPVTGVSAPANTCDHVLLPTTLDGLTGWQPLPEQSRCTYASYDYQPCRAALADHGLLTRLSGRGLPAPIQIGRQ